MKRILSILLCIVFCLGLSACSGADTDPAEGTTATTDDNDPYTFETVAKAKAAIKKESSRYENNRITVKGSVLKRDNVIIISDARGDGGAMFRSEALRSPNITIVMADKKMGVLLENGDYVKITGTVKISETEIYLDICEYEMIDSIYD